MTEIRKPGLSKILAWVLLAACLLLLFLPWISLHISYMGQSFSLREAVRMALAASGETEESLRAELVEALQETTEDFAEYGIRFDAEATADAGMDLLDGRFSPFRAARDAAAVGAFLKAGVRYSTLSEGGRMDPFEQQLMNRVESLGGRLRVDAALFWILGILLILALLFAAWCVYAGRTRWMLAAPAAALALMLLTVIAVARNNAFIKDMLGILSQEAGAEAAAVIGFLGGSFKLFHLTAAPFLCLAFAALAWCVLRFDLGSGKLGGISLSGGWTCAACGAKAPDSAAFCPTCGTKRPQRPVCPTCGKILKVGMAFCDQCGTPAPKQEPAPAQEVAQTPEQEE